MNQLNAAIRNGDDESGKPELEAEVLMTRIVDGEATDHDRERFTRLAEANPEMWRRLALRQQDMTLLKARVEHELSVIDQSEVPQSAVANNARMHLGPSLRWLIALSSLAAVVVISAIWFASSIHTQDSQNVQGGNLIPAGNSAAELTPDEHLRLYLQAGFVIGELPPTLLQVDEMSDGRKAARILRRIEEVIILPSDQDVPVDDQGALTKPPSELRSDEPISTNPD
jgi:hypothetical protein